MAKPDFESPDDRNLRLLGVALSVDAAKNGDSLTKPEALADSAIQTIQGVHDGENSNRSDVPIVQKTIRPD